MIDRILNVQLSRDNPYIYSTLGGLGANEFD